MGKENENIHLHIIANDYHLKQKEQKLQFDVTGKSDSLNQLLQNNKYVVTQLEKMHMVSAAVTDLERLQSVGIRITKEKLTKNREKPITCNHHFGYLSERDRKEQFPDECIVCTQVVECMLRKIRKNTRASSV